MTDAELSKELALALGYAPESVRVVKPWPPEPKRDYCDVYRITNDMGPFWRKFDYRDPSVCLPLLEGLMVQHEVNLLVERATNVPVFRLYKLQGLMSRQYKGYTLAEAVARAVIAVRKGE